MAIVRANDPKANDLRHQTLMLIGKLCDRDLSISTQKDIMGKLTRMLHGTKIDDKFFSGVLRTEWRIINESDTGLKSLIIHVPKEYVAAAIDEDRDNQWVVFDINKATNVTGFKGSDVVTEDK